MAKYEARPSKSLPVGRNSRNQRVLSRIRESRIRSWPIYFKAECPKDIVNALESIESDIQCGQPILWKRIFRVLGAMRTHKIMKPHSLKLLREIINVIEKHQCKDALVISEVFLVLFHFTLGGTPGVMNDATCEILRLILYNDLHGQPVFDLSQYLYSQYQICQEGGSPFDLLWHAAIRGNIGLMRLELKFGVGLMIPQDTLHHCLEYLHEFMINFLEGDYVRMQEKVFHDFGTESIKRLLLILRVLKFVQQVQRKPELKHRLVQCYNLLFDSIPEAYISTTEVEAYLKKCLPESIQHQRENLDSIRKYAEDVRTMLPQITEGPEPRSLKHLSRIQVRQALRQNLNLPYGLSSLPLPEILKKYITLNDDGDYRLIVTGDNVSASGEEIRCIVFPHTDDTIISFLKSL